MVCMCPRLDSNQHAVASTTPSRWQVYQFLHVGKNIREDAKIIFCSDNFAEHEKLPANHHSLFFIKIARIEIRALKVCK